MTAHDLNAARFQFIRSPGRSCEDLHEVSLGQQTPNQSPAQESCATRYADAHFLRISKSPVIFRRNPARRLDYHRDATARSFEEEQARI